MAKNLIDYVQAHERMWGGEKYPNRPSLEDILKSPVVAFWIDGSVAGGKKHIITLHDDFEPIRQYVALLVRRLPIGFPGRRLTMLWIDGQEIRLGVKVGFRTVEVKEHPE